MGEMLIGIVTLILFLAAGTLGLIGALTIFNVYVTAVQAICMWVTIIFLILLVKNFTE